MSKLSKEMESAMNKQIVEELHSAYIYLGISRWAEERSMHHYASWMHLQAKEEFAHAEKFMKFITERGGHVELGTLEAVKSEFENTEETIKLSIGHEQFITSKIHELMDLAQSTKDYPSIEFLNWYVKEQVEEEDAANDLLATYELQGKKDGLWDHHLKRS
ncbi:hypothetical protein NEF87_001683 [Candidatus Lokiarchaeum ossiferum]|uniref:Ferritin-like diiron domain-containing protein n=1 Tax=Candidatus Lokiarchaeum ossiferum TaxID=2951803 RepID=A0ABY6HPF2_9ARCH|nr:hypothetical protein NEF87_001683 [Candidatus Lokiarchaeum sp. B-35]